MSRKGCSIHWTLLMEFINAVVLAMFRVPFSQYHCGRAFQIFTLLDKTFPPDPFLWMPQEEEEAEEPCSDIVWRHECWSPKTNQKQQSVALFVNISSTKMAKWMYLGLSPRKRHRVLHVPILNFAFQKTEKEKTDKVGPYQLQVGL